MMWNMMLTQALLIFSDLSPKDQAEMLVQKSRVFQEKYFFFG